MIMAFMIIVAVNAAKNKDIKLSSSVSVVYEYYADQFNQQYSTDYHADQEDITNYRLIPSFSSMKTYYHLGQKSAHLYYMEAFNKIGSEQQRIYYFRGTYLLLKGLKGDFQYRDKPSLSGGIINTLKSLYGTDDNDVHQYETKTAVGSGSFYSHGEKEMPSMMNALIKKIKTYSFVANVQIALKDE